MSPGAEPIDFSSGSSLKGPPPSAASLDSGTPMHPMHPQSVASAPFILGQVQIHCLRDLCKRF